MSPVLPYDSRGYQLLHDGAIALAEVEGNGIRTDVELVESSVRELKLEVKAIRETLSETKVMKRWRNRFRQKTNFNSSVQLAKVLFEDMKYKPRTFTASGKPSTDEDALLGIDDPFVENYLAMKKKQKAVEFLTGIRREVCDGFLHPNFNLHSVTTYRSSSDAPNFQNLPVRNEDLKKRVRGAIRARRGRRLVELDYKQIEVGIACCYHDDPTMHTYLRDKTKDMHRDAAQECFMLDSPAEVTKMARYAAKNRFVFPEFYGDWWLDCAGEMWRSIPILKLTTASGVPMLDHLASKGITELGRKNRERTIKEGPRAGTFEAHLKEVERGFWTDRFPVYARWKKAWFQQYLKQGYFLTKTGFICAGVMSRNDAINYPVQGSAFHCLLQALVWIQKEIHKRGLKTLLIGQIHDSILADVPDGEVEEFAALCRHVMTVKLPKRWKWITVPLEIEIEVSPIGGSWVDKKEWREGQPLPN